MRRSAILILYLITCLLLLSALFGCGGTSPTLELPTGSKGYVLHVSAKRTEIMVDFNRKDGISTGTILDVYKLNVPDMDGPVKIGEITVEKVGRKMSKAKVTAITSSLRMENGDKVFPHPVTVVTDASWLTSRRLMDGWNSDTDTSEERIWESCEVLSRERVRVEPEVRQLIADTGVQPVWHPSVKGRYGDLYFRKVFLLDAKIADAKLNVVCGGRANVYLNGRWVGEAKEWPEISSFKVRSLVERGRNIVAVHTVRDQRSLDPAALFLALTVETQFR